MKYSERIVVKVCLSVCVYLCVYVFVCVFMCLFVCLKCECAKVFSYFALGKLCLGTINHSILFSSHFYSFWIHCPSMLFEFIQEYAKKKVLDRNLTKNHSHEEISFLYTKNVRLFLVVFICYSKVFRIFPKCL